MEIELQPRQQFNHRGLQEQRSRYRRRRSSSWSCCVMPQIMLILAAAATIIRLPSTIGSIEPGRSLQQSSAELVDLFNEVTDNQATVLEEEEVVSGGTVYATCPDLSAITGPMYEADTDSDGYINQEEYVQFADAISGGFLSQNGWDSEFNDMPLTLQETYLVLSCLCELYPGQPWGGVGCCKTNDITGSSDGTGIRTDGTQPGTTPNADELQYLTYVCGTMSESLENVGGTVVPPPTTLPVTSRKPTLQPVEPTPVPEPTIEPSTSFPSGEPSQQPTKRPSKKPVTPPPTESPTTLLPTISPSISSGPSLIPTLTSKPTIFPTQSIASSLALTSKPTMFPIQTIAPSPAVSSEPTTELLNNITKQSPTISPSISNSPSFPPYSSISPSVSIYPTLSGAPSFPLYTGNVPVVLTFVANLNNSEITADEIMEGKTNQVKLMLEEQLLVLSDVVIEEEFGNTTTGTVITPVETSSVKQSNRLRLRIMERILIVDEAVDSIVDDVQDAPCPSNGTVINDVSGCFNFTNTIILRMVDERNVASQTDLFKNTMLTKIADGWLTENFDLEEALKPPPPTPGPTNTVDRGEITPPEPSTLSSGAIIGIIIAALIVSVLIALITMRARRTKPASNTEEDLERQVSPNDSELARDGFDESSAMIDDSSSSLEKSFSSQDHLLQGQMSSTADTPPALEKLQSEDESEGDDGYDSSDQYEYRNTSSQSALGVMAAASTLVASSSNLSPTSVDSYSTMDVAESSSTLDLASDHSINISDSFLGRNDSGVDSLDVTAGSNSANRAEGGNMSVLARAGGMSPGTTAVIGAAGAAVVAAAGVAAVGSYQGSGQSDKKEDDSKASTSSTPNSTMDDLENAIESGNWGQVGALAAVLASQGTGPSRKKSSRSTAGLSTTSYDSSGASSSRGSQSNNHIDQARAAEIDKLVEAGDWQGVVLAAARFEADQTFDGESVSASASQSSRFTGSATSAMTPRSMATGDMSASNVSNQRGQEEIRAEVEALVRRVVPEEADNIDEMMTQFRGREEELVETLRRMQERAIASRARLAVQKSAKLEARAKASPRGTSVSSAKSVASVGSTKSELEQAIEAGNWHAVGLAAQKMSDSSIGDLSSAEKARLRDAISQSPAFSRRVSRGTPDEVDKLDQLIEQGDWQGVIAAAKRASEVPNEGILDEQDALDQANMWQEIADQSKQEARQGPAGAGDAAAWAISRSLNALKTADESTAAVRTIHDIADEQSTDASQYESSSYGDSVGRSSQDEFRHVI